MTLGIVKRNEQEFAEWLTSVPGYLTAVGVFEDEPFVPEHYQLSFLENRSRYRWVTKSRQVGLSLIMALEALARCHLRDRYNAIFVSYNLDDAKEKILAARQVYEELPLGFQKRLVVDSRTELAFESNSGKKKLARIMSHPSKAPRGKKGDVYLDELAHYVNDREVYRGSTALISRAQGQLTGCSTPLGRRGIFWEIAEEQLRKYPNHSKQKVPWWLCSFFSTDVGRALKEARLMPTEERVQTFGRPPLLEQFDSLVLEDFQQEFEGAFVDESYSFYPYDLVLPCTDDKVKVVEDPTDIPAPKDDGRIVAGFDVGRVHDRSELAVFEERDGHFTCRLLRTYQRIPFAAQEAELRRLLATVPVARLSIDRSGIGMNLAENLSGDFPQVVAEVFTNESKERWATDFKILLQHQDISLPKDRITVAQIHSIKRRVLPSGKFSFEADRNEQGHADRFWAMALACQKERGWQGGGVRIGVRILG